VGLGLPNTVPGTNGRACLPTGRPLRTAGFSSLGTIDPHRLPEYEPVVCALRRRGRDERISLVTDVLIGPLPQETQTMVDKQFLSSDAWPAANAPRRPRLGIGGRETDAAITPGQVRPTGKWLDVTALREDPRHLDADGDLGPRSVSAPPARPHHTGRGGAVQASFERAAKLRSGWTQGGSGASSSEQTSPNLDDA